MTDFLLLYTLPNDTYADYTHRRRRYIAIIDPHISNVADEHDFRNLVNNSLCCEIECLLAKALTVILISFFGIAIILYYAINGGIF